ncbi:MAG: hypothetical protein HY873_02225, partial [Chloroflexi bacterium]|nr:hypothetical protein [Chloroflexota bacterium]
VHGANENHIFRGLQIGDGEALRLTVEIRHLSGTHFDPAIVDAFLDLYATNVLRDLDVDMARQPDDDHDHEHAA